MVVSLDLKFEVSKRLQSSGVDVDQVVDELAPAIAAALALSIRGRVVDNGDLAGQAFPGYSLGPPLKLGATRAKSSHFYVSGRYPGPRGREMPSGAEAFESSAEFHALAGVVPGSYNVTGGMWSGLTVMILTPTLVRLLFRGRSEGQDPRFLNGKSRPIKVSNALKAWTVLDKHGVNVLALSEQELDRIGIGVVRSVAMGVGNDLPVEWQGEQPPKASVQSILSAAISGR